jgi:hypothetical protein
LEVLNVKKDEINEINNYIKEYQEKKIAKMGLFHFCKFSPTIYLDFTWQ